MELCVRALMAGLTEDVRGHVQASQSLSRVYSYERRPQVFQRVCFHVHVLPGQNGSDCLMKSLSFWGGREVDALH